jgi:Zn finger protein HypA/HybF involved in hydrogenase expression
MPEVYDRQKMQEDMQKNQSFVDAFSKIVSGKAGYKASIEYKQSIIKCKKCNTILEDNEKFCHECGAKVEK